MFEAAAIEIVFELTPDIVGHGRAPRPSGRAGILAGLGHDRVHTDDCADCDDPGKGLIEKITSDVQISGIFNEAQSERLAQIASRCPVHKTLAQGVAFEDNGSFG